VHQDILNLIRLLDLNANAYAIHTGLDQDSFVLIAGDCQGVEQDFWGTGGFDFGDVVAF